MFNQHEYNSNWLAQEVHTHGLHGQDDCSDIQTELTYGPFLKVGF